MAKRSHKQKEYSEVQMLKKQNAELKRTILKLRRQIDRLPNIQSESISEHYKEEQTPKHPTYKCPSCKDGTLQSVTLFKRGIEHSYNSCNLCGYRTPLAKVKK